MLIVGRTRKHFFLKEIFELGFEVVLDDGKCDGVTY